MNTGLFDPRGGAGEIPDRAATRQHDGDPMPDAALDLESALSAPAGESIYDMPHHEPGLAFSRLMVLDGTGEISATLTSCPHTPELVEAGQYVGAIWPWLNPRRTPLANNIERGETLRQTLASRDFVRGSQTIVDVLAAMAGISSRDLLTVLPFEVNVVWLPNASTTTRPGHFNLNGEPCEGIDATPGPRECVACLNRCVPHRLHYGRRATRADFAVAWWEYLDMRWRIFGEWPSTATQLATLDNLRVWHRPIDCLRQSIAGSFKSVFPLREDLDAGLYKRSGYSIRTTRCERSTAAPWVRDTVRCYRLVPDWRSKLATTTPQEH